MITPFQRKVPSNDCQIKKVHTKNGVKITMSGNCTKEQIEAIKSMHDINERKNNIRNNSEETF